MLFNFFKNDEKEKKIEELTEALKKSESLVEELKRTVADYRNREEIIYSLHAEAEERKQKLLDETEQYIESLRSGAEEDVECRLAGIQEKIQQLSAFDLELQAKGEYLKVQMRRILTEQLKYIDDLDISAYSILNSVAKEAKVVADSVEEDSKVLVKFPTPAPSSVKEEVPVYKFIGE